MHWLDARTLILDPAAELAADYEGCGVAPRAGAFGLVAPYASGAGDDVVAEQEGGDKEGAAAAGDAGFAGGALDGETPKRKRKRKRPPPSGDEAARAAAALRATREAEAQRCAHAHARHLSRCVPRQRAKCHPFLTAAAICRRHEDALPSLVRALALYAEHLASQPPRAVAQPDARDAGGDTAEELPSLVATAEAGAPLQLLLQRDEARAPSTEPFLLRV